MATVKNGKVRVTIEMPEAWHALLAQVGDDNERDVSKQLRSVIRAWVTDHEKPKRKPRKKKGGTE